MTGSLSALVAARLAPLRIITAAWPLDDWLPCIQITAHPTAEGQQVTVVCWHTSRARAEDAASAIFRLLNGWDPPGPWHRVTARVAGTWQPAGFDRAWATVTAETRWEGLDAPMDE
ncbi:hypothetical protein [Propionibacterium australiense]|uniref:DUF3168 domain-containing protein n=1 Tax=Propionibacterium australiense TaxID=119981 RepID=A0A8B3GEW1_9ACTN|nr:hypothetical protein [Propionibacterium australiense]RLP08921.1 hypothetical protein D7U36_08925 [Propionibacterium australiense]